MKVEKSELVSVDVNANVVVSDVVAVSIEVITDELVLASVSTTS